MIKALLTVVFTLMFINVVNARDFGIKSPAFKNNQTIPEVYTCNGKSQTPGLAWNNIPENTHSFALIVSSPDSTVSAMHYLWVLYNIPADIIELSEGAHMLPEGIQVGTNSMGEIGYTAPCPHDGRVYTYVFTVYALDTPYIHFKEGANAEEVLDKIKKHIIKQAELIGKFNH